MRILVAPDSFKGSLSAFEAAEAMRRGARRAHPDVDVDLCPVSDGGEGVLDVLMEGRGGSVHVTRVVGPTGGTVEARFGLVDDGRTAVIESAAAIGLGLVPDAEQRPLETTTYGVGQLVLCAVAAGARTIIVGLGGSATTDGGAGMAQALGVTLEGAGVPATGGRLGEVRRIDVTGRASSLSGVELVALTDVDCPLSGPAGAAHVFGAQKGAGPEERAVLDLSLCHLASVAGDPGETPGDGAAGGLGYGLRVFAGAKRQGGIQYVLDRLRFDERLGKADLVLTGEGRIDGQSARGKVVSGVCQRARAANLPVVALVGAVGEGATELHDRGLTAHFSLCDRPMTEGDAMSRAAELLAALTTNVVRLFAEARPTG